MPNLHKYKSTNQTGTCGSCGVAREKHCCGDYYRQRTIEYVDYEEWLPNVSIAVSEEIADPILYDFIRRGAIEFAKRTGVLKRNITLKLEDCVADYYPCVGDQERIDIVDMLSINGQCYQAIGDTCSWQVGGHKYWFHPPHTLEIHPAPKIEKINEVILTVKAVPSESSHSVDRLIYDRYFEAITHYAIAQAMLIPLSTEEKKKSVSGEVMVYRQNEFKKEVNRAKIDLARHYSSESQYYGLY